MSMIVCLREAHSEPSELGQIGRVSSLMIGGVILSRHKRECVFYKMIEFESKRGRRMRHVSTLRSFSPSSPSSVEAFEALFSLCNSLSGTLKARSINGHSMLFNTRSDDRSLNLLFKTVHHRSSPPRHILAPQNPARVRHFLPAAK